MSLKLNRHILPLPPQPWYKNEKVILYDGNRQILGIISDVDVDARMVHIETEEPIFGRRFNRFSYEDMAMLTSYNIDMLEDETGMKKRKKSLIVLLIIILFLIASVSLLVYSLM